MPTTTRARAVLLLTCALPLLAGCVTSPTASIKQSDGTLVTYTGTPVCTTTQVTAMVTRSDRGCFLLDGYPLTFPEGSTWAGTDGQAVRLPGGGDVRPGDVVSGQVCSAAPLPEWAGYDCGVASGDPVRGLVGGVSVEPRG